MPESKRPHVFDYIDYRSYLKDLIEHLRLRGKFSVRSFALAADFKSIGYLSMILKGQRNLSLKSANKIGHALDLPDTEIAFFEKLVAFSQAISLLEKDKLYNELLDFKKFKKMHLADASQYELFSHWYIVAVFEAMGTELKSKSIESLSEAIRVSTKDIDHAIEVLSRLGFIKRENDEWKRTEAAVSTEATIQSLGVRKFHKEMIGKALAAIDDHPKETRELSSLTISLSEKAYSEVKRRLFQFQQDINAIFSEDPDPEKIYQLNFQLFPLAQVKLKAANDALKK